MNEDEIREKDWNREQLAKTSKQNKNDTTFITATTPYIEKHPVIAYKGLVFGEVMQGTDALSGAAAGIADMFGARSDSYESYLVKAREKAIDEMIARARKRGANAILGIGLECEVVDRTHMLLVTASGTAVIIEM